MKPLMLIIFFATIAIAQKDTINTSRQDTSTIKPDLSNKPGQLVNSLPEMPFVDSITCVFTKPEVNGNRPMVDIQRTIIQNQTSMRFLYSKWLKINPKTDNVVVMKFRMVSSGEVIDCHIPGIDDMVVPEFGIEMMKKVLKWEFPKLKTPDDTTSVVHKFLFKKI
jgi:hypothetical protein